ncbi:MAG: GNAT family N-acetyltransferase [Anaerolineales bacterium]|nr:GNAT family N-acetyltransferase [Anaerolineales bacterium]
MPDTTHIRPAREVDVPKLAELLVQLYAAELPGALTAPLDQQNRLLQFTLEAQPEQALQNRFVLCDASDRILATGMLQLPTLPRFDRAPAGTISMAVKTLGYSGLGQLLLTVARSQIGVYGQRQADTAFLHSIVVDAQQRGRGLGRVMLKALEDFAAGEGCAWAALQVLSGNQAAYQLYSRSGYVEVWQAPRWVALLSWPSCVMRKALKNA